MSETGRNLSNYHLPKQIPTLTLKISPSFGHFSPFRPVSDVLPSFGRFANFRKFRTFRPVSESHIVSEVSPSFGHFAQFRTFRPVSEVSPRTYHPNNLDELNKMTSGNLFECEKNRGKEKDLSKQMAGYLRGIEDTAADIEFVADLKMILESIEKDREIIIKKISDNEKEVAKKTKEFISWKQTINETAKGLVRSTPQIIAVAATVAIPLLAPSLCSIM
ncbi:15438_t:CDS:2 [Racocetra persica]|uniref:15438_t:CDS:1 n=1 Tax=Racocetra persica TaxID=160502 RepID=A0ACA9KU58_9GLOM|nr:15438_t:CDS:2 [Racocetra persica]